MSIEISYTGDQVSGTIKLDGSKSLSNRALIIRALCKEDFAINNICESDDSNILQRLLSQPSEEAYDTGHAGTCYRFMTAYLALQKGTQILTGSARMKERPIGILVEALRSLGANIDYLENEGYPPLKINEIDPNQVKSEVSIAGSVSSQYISALIMIAPTLPKGLIINITGELVSRPYLEMTLKMMSHFGIEYSFTENQIVIAHQDYIAKDILIEADWSAASYYYSIASILPAEITVQGLFNESWQGDSAAAELGKAFGIETNYGDKQVTLTSNPQNRSSMFDHDFVKEPDIAQTFAIMCGANGVEGFFTGLQTLRIKETDRIDALKTELSKVGVALYKLPPKMSKKSGKEYYGISGTVKTDATPVFETYKDHRMAMAFAPLSMLFPIRINKPEVVSKSYSNYWEDLKSLGFEVKELSPDSES